MQRGGGGKPPTHGHGGHAVAMVATSADDEANRFVPQPLLVSVDVMQLAALAAAASSAASSTAHAVDAVVNEAVLFFATMPPLQAVQARFFASGLGGSGGAVDSDVFKVFGKRAHADACAAADACAQAYQLAGKSDGNSSKGAGGAALSAGKVVTHAERTAQTAREAAQLCMGILEEAVQANASPLARETAKRCAEQALLSIEAATVAEHHSHQLRDLLTRVNMGSEFPTMPSAGPSQLSPMAPAHAATSGTSPAFAVVGGGCLSGYPSVAASWLGTGGSGAIAAGGGMFASRSRHSSGDALKSAKQVKRRWWDEGSENIVQFGANPGRSAGGSCSASPATPSAASSAPAGTVPPDPPPLMGRPEEAIRGAKDLEQYLAMRVRLSSEADGSRCDDRSRGASGSSGGNCTVAMSSSQGHADDDERALQTIVDWRYGQAVAQNCKEEDILADGDAIRLACWHCPTDEALPADLFAALQLCGHEQLSNLVTALQRTFAVRDGDTSFSFAANGSPLEIDLEESSAEQKVEASDWDNLFDRLGWVASDDLSSQRQSADGIAASIAMWQEDQSVVVAASPTHSDEFLDPTEDGWTVDGMTLRQLHLMSMHSRSKQRRGGQVKHKALSEDNTSATAPSQPQEKTPPVSAEDEEAEVRRWLRDVFGDVADSDASGPQEEGNTVARIGLGAVGGLAGCGALFGLGTAAASLPCAFSATAGVGHAPGHVLPSAKAREAPAKRGGKKKRPVAAVPPPALVSQPASAVTVPSSVPAMVTASSVGGLASGAALGASVSAGARSGPCGVGGVSVVPTSPEPMDTWGREVHRLIEPPQLLKELPEDDDVFDEEDEETDEINVDQPLGLGADGHLGMQTGPVWGLDHPDRFGPPLLPPFPKPLGSTPYLPGQGLARLARTFHEGMEHIAVQRREAYGIRDSMNGLSWPSSASAAGDGLPENNRARTFNEGVKPEQVLGGRSFGQSSAFSSIPTPAGPFIRTPTWTSVDSAEFERGHGLHHAVARDDLHGPLYVQASPKQWLGDLDDAPMAQSSSSDRNRAFRGIGGGPRGAWDM